MNKFITPKQANEYYGVLMDIIERYKNCEPGQKLSNDLPLFVYFIKRLRTPFHNIVINIQINDLPTHTKLGAKLRYILDNFNSNRKFTFRVMDAWKHVNEAEHYLENKAMKNLPDFEFTIQCMAEFIRTFSETDIPNNLKKFYWKTFSQNSGQNPVQKEPSIPKKKTEVIPVITDREKYLGTKAATMLPIMFVLDVSKSMSSEDRILELNKGAKWFYKAMRTDEITRDCVEISIVTFGHDVIQTIKFSGIDDQAELFEKLSLEANGECTNIGLGMNIALEAILKLKNEYSDAGLDYHQPWVVLITDCDGQGIDDYEIAAQKTSDVINQDRLVIFPIGVGTGDLKILKDFSPKRDPIKMKEKSFGQFFDWLKENALFISKSRPDEKAPLSSPSGWATL